LTIPYISDPKQRLITGSVIRLKGGASTQINIHTCFNIIDFANLSFTTSNNTSSATLIQDSTYYLHIKMDSISIYKVSQESQEPSIDTNWDVIYWYDNDYAPDTGWEDDVETAIHDTTQADDLGMHLWTYPATTVTASNIG